MLSISQSFNLKIPGGQFDPPVVFPLNASSIEKVKPCFFVTFNIIISHIFPEYFIEIPHIIQNI